MLYLKTVKDGYIISLLKGDYEGNITKEEYDNILSIIFNKPTAPDGYDYRLKEDLSWELYEMPIIEESDE